MEQFTPRSKSALIEEARKESERADERYHELRETLGAHHPDTIAAMREAESLYGSWAEWYYGTE